MSGYFVVVDRVLPGQPLIPPIIMGANRRMLRGDGIEFEHEGVRNRLMVVREANEEEWLKRYPVNERGIRMPFYHEVVGD